MRSSYVGIALLGLCLYLSCIEDDFFGLSSFGRIKAIEVSNQAGQAVINNDSSTIAIPMPPGIDLSELIVRQLTLSSFATADLQVNDIIDLRTDREVHVRAEDGSLSTWTLSAVVTGASPQIPNSDFNTWYETPTGYLEPGSSADATIWGTSNPGTQIISILAVTPVEVDHDDLAAKCETIYNGRLADMFGTPISTGSIYVGKFNTENININDPRAAIDFGTPYAARPSSFKIEYMYTPGSENQDRDGNVLNFPDACDIYLLLEVRQGGTVERLGTAWFRSENIVETPTPIEVDVIYGPLDASFPEFMFPEDHGFVSADSATFILPTHLTFVAASSFDGHNFAGAIESVLVIDNFELLYD